jgi:hypothetical protein
MRTEHLDPSRRDDWSVAADILMERECAAALEVARTMPPADVEAGAEALRNGDFAEWAFRTVREHAERLQAGADSGVIVLDDYRRRT